MGLCGKAAGSIPALGAILCCRKFSTPNSIRTGRLNPRMICGLYDRMTVLSSNQSCSYLAPTGSITIRQRDVSRRLQQIQTRLSGTSPQRRSRGCHSELKPRQELKLTKLLPYISLRRCLSTQARGSSTEAADTSGFNPAPLQDVVKYLFHRGVLGSSFPFELTDEILDKKRFRRMPKRWPAKLMRFLRTLQLCFCRRKKLGIDPRNPLRYWTIITARGSIVIILLRSEEYLPCWQGGASLRLLYRYSDMRLLDFVSKVGRVVKLSHMLRKHVVKERLDNESTGMSFAEFTYQVLQGYDWWRLYVEMGCGVQVGGSDQLGNLSTGHYLIRRLREEGTYKEDHEPIGLCSPLLTSDDGQKLSKSSEKIIPWLCADKTSPFQLYQYLRGIKDADVAKYLSLLTFYPTDELRSIVAKHNTRPELWFGQEKLAEQVTLLVHGRVGLESALRITDALYKSDVTRLASLTPLEIVDLRDSVKMVDVKFDASTTLFELAQLAGCYESNAAADQAIRAGGLYVNFMRIKDPDAIMIRGTHILPNDITLLRSGKRRNFLIRWFDPDLDSDLND